MENGFRLVGFMARVPRASSPSQPRFASSAVTLGIIAYVKVCIKEQLALIRYWRTDGATREYGKLFTLDDTFVKTLAQNRNFYSRLIISFEMFVWFISFV